MKLTSSDDNSAILNHTAVWDVGVTCTNYKESRPHYFSEDYTNKCMKLELNNDKVILKHVMNSYSEDNFCIAFDENGMMDGKVCIKNASIFK